MILIESIGAISHNGQIYVDADGSTDPDWVTDYNMYDEINHCALIARIGAGGEVRFVGVSRKIRVIEGGPPLLGINDRDPTNNEGSFDVSIRIIE